MKTISLVLATSILTAICRAGLIPLEPLRTVVHPRYKPDVYAQFGNHDVECGHVSTNRLLERQCTESLLVLWLYVLQIATVKRGDERKCQERCHQYSSLLKEDCNAYTFRPGRNGGESTCMLKNYRCRPANWKRRHQSGLLGGCS